MTATREQVLALVAKRDEMETEMSTIKAELDSYGVGTAGKLVTEDGFPRNDIDIPAIRSLRLRLLRLENDIKGIYEEIRLGLQQVFSPAASAESRQHPPEPSEPFCYVNSIAPDSPAQEAGLQPGDKIINFGSVNAKNHNALQGLAHEASRGKPITVVVMRETTDSPTETSLVIQPRTGWGGRGALGCHILPLPTM